jgi:3-hydroxyisobutyrate dehydrogenase-like beta-hydroxyacid dehydrogenase
MAGARSFNLSLLEDPMTRISFLGTGLLGSAFVEAALGRGDHVTVWNRTIEKARALEAFGANVATDPAEAVRGAARVHLVLRDDASVESVINQLRPGLSPEAIIVDHTTTLPAPTAERATRLNAEGVRYLHCPVFIGPAAARKAGGFILVSGRQDLFDAVRAALEAQASRVEYLGDRPDLAAVHKLAGNAFLLGTVGLVADILTIAKGSGASAGEIITRLGDFNSANIVAGRGTAMVNQNYTTSFELTMARKDVQLMIEAAGELPLAILPGMAARMDELIAQGHGQEDLAVLGRDAV